MPIEFAKLSSKDLAALDPTQTIFFFPVGGLENHGPHLPLGLDLFEAETLCRVTAQKIETEMSGWKTVLMPSAPFAVDSDSGISAILVRPHVLRDWLVDACRCLSKSGFRHFACLSGNLGPRQLTAIEEAGKIITNPYALLFRMHKRRLLSLSSALASVETVKASPLWSDPNEHGGKRDTSVALAISKSLVKPEYKELPSSQLSLGFFERALNKWRGKLPGYWGRPAEATEEDGWLILQKTSEQLIPDLKAVFQGHTELNKFRSWYSLLPPNKSFFKSWVLFFTIMAMFVFWLMYWSLIL